MALKKSAGQKDPAKKIADLLAAIEKRFDQNIKCTIGDYIRLLQVQQEFDRNTPRDIEVTWVESLKRKSESEE